MSAGVRSDGWEVYALRYAERVGSTGQAFIFDDLHTLDDIVARTDWMRESPLHMGWWVMASFALKNPT